jgi:filamentous hemagglutinin family protein
MRIWPVLLILGISTAAANPRGGTVVAGTATITAAGKTLTIRQSSLQGIINWQAFENTPSETIAFQQPAASAVTLNRVVGIDPSLIAGNLTANGKVFLINPNGIVFGPTARVNVNSLVASSLSLADSDFLQGKNVFNPTPGEPSSVINQGRITTLPGGTVALVAPIVNNAGSIEAPAGQVILQAAGHYALQTADPGPNVNVAGTSVRMAAIGLTPTLRDVVNTSSLATANQVEVRNDGTVYLHQAGGIAVNEGSIRTDATLIRAAGSVLISANNAVAFRSGSQISSTGRNITAKTGSVRVEASLGGLYYTGPSSPDPATRASVHAGSVEVDVRDKGNVVSTPDASLAFKGDSIRFYVDEGDVGSASAPVRVRGGRLNLFSEKRTYIQADGDIDVGFVQSDRSVRLTATGSILSGVPPEYPNVRLAGGGTAAYLNVLSDDIQLQAGGTIGSPDHHLAIHQRVGTAPTGPFIDVIPRPLEVAPGSLLVITPVDPAAANRPNYVPPTDGSSTSLGGSTIGAPDNVILPALRAAVVKGEEYGPSEGSGLITVVRRTDSEDEEEALAKGRRGTRVARARTRR